MSEMKHTPGPWKEMPIEPWGVENDRASCTTSVGIGARKGTPLALVVATGFSDNPVFDANARLIAAAPELLEALQNLLADIGEAGADGYCENSIHIDEVTAAHAAITKATAQPHISQGER